MGKRTIFITGSTNGMGKAAATALAKQGHSIILHGRKKEDARRVRQELITKTNNTDIDFVTGDLLTSNGVREIADAVKAKHQKIDVLINNAGSIMNDEREETSEGVEKTIALNLNAPFLLTSLLLETLEKSDDPRIVSTASIGHSLMAKPDFDDIELKKNYTANRAYGNAKLFLIMSSQRMDEEFKRSSKKITVNTLHPGVVLNNGMLDKMNSKGFIGKNILLPLLRLFMKSPEQGAETIIYLASSDEVKGKSGGYYANSKPAKVNEKHISQKTKQIVWQYCIAKTGATGWS